MSPRYLTEIYANMVSRSADSMIASTRLVNNMMFANMDMFKAWMQQAKDNARELSRIGVNSTKTFEQTSRDTATATTRIGGGHVILKKQGQSAHFRFINDEDKNTGKQEENQKTRK